MFVFPLIYISVFFVSLKNLVNQNKQALLSFLIFGLPIYTTALSVTLQMGFGSFVPFMQPFKEILILIILGLSLWELNTRLKFQAVDYAVFAYFAYTLLYVVLPIGHYGFTDKMIAFKSSSFFTLIYFAGRLFKPSEIYINKYFHYVLVVIIAASLVLMFEIITNQHFQTFTGYADFNFNYFKQEPSGNYGLSWTFETSTGLKRFASFFANPLEFAASTLVALAIIAGLYTTEENRFKLDKLGILALAATQFSIFFAMSRSSFISYIIMVYVFALITKKKTIVYAIYAASVAILLYFMFFMFFINPDLYDFIYETITFTNPSSIGHVIAWLEGLNAILNNPFGLGLGESGRVAVSLSDTVGGENQYIIIGVQTGIIALLLYIWIHIYFIRTCWQWYPKLKGKERKTCLALLLMKVGLIIPLFTSELESSVYISYFSWFLSGLFVHMIAENDSITNKSLEKL